MSNRTMESDSLSLLSLATTLPKNRIEGILTTDSSYSADEICAAVRSRPDLFHGINSAYYSILRRPTLTAEDFENLIDTMLFADQKMLRSAGRMAPESIFINAVLLPVIAHHKYINDDLFSRLISEVNGYVASDFFNSSWGLVSTLFSLKSNTSMPFFIHGEEEIRKPKYSTRQLDALSEKAIYLLCEPDSLVLPSAVRLFFEGYELSDKYGAALDLLC